MTTFTPFEQTLLAVLGDIANSLHGIAGYAEHLHQQAIGEKVHEIGGYVRSENAGGALVHLYSTHPGLKFRVGAVYSENFAHLPFDPAIGKPWDGEQAPSRDAARQKGYMVDVAPFKVAFLPTGATTDAGQPVFRFSRVIGGPPPAPIEAPTAAAPAALPDPAAADTHVLCEWCGDAPSAPGVPCVQCARLGAKPGDGANVRPIGASQPTPETPTASAPHACPHCAGDWRFYNPDCRTHVQPDGEAAPAIERGKQPLSPSSLRLWLRNEAYRFGSRKCSQRQRHDLSGAWKTLVTNDDIRRTAKRSLTGYESTGDMPDALVLALHAWLRPAGANGDIHFTDSMAGDEIALVIDALRGMS